MVKFVVNLFTGYNEKNNETFETKALTLLFGYLSILLSVVYIIISAIQNHYTLIAALLAYVVATIVNLEIFRRSPDNKINIHIFVLLLSIMLLTASVLAVDDISPLFWIFLYPVVVMLIYDKKEGIIITSLFLILVGISLFLPIQNRPEITTLNKITFLLVYLSVFFVAYFVKLLKENVAQQLKERIEENKSTISVKNDLIAKLSWQIRGPLSNIMGITTFMSETNLDDIQRNFVETIKESTNNLVNVVNNIGEKSKIKLNLDEDKIADFDIYRTVKEAIKSFDEEYSENARIDLLISDDIPANMLGNAVRLNSILKRILENYAGVALKDSISGKKSITINITASKETKELMECMFEIKADLPGKSMQKAEQGLGALDYSEVKDMIEAAGGRLKMSSENKRIIYTFTMSLKKAAKEDEQEVDNTQEQEDTTAEQKQPQKQLNEAEVLLVEDNLINQKIMMLNLQKEVKAIDVANNGREALEKIGTKKYDIVLMDIQMPIMDGIKTTQKLRELEESTNTHIPVIAITANALSGDREKCIEAGMDDYLSKPYKVEVLFDKMRTLLENDKEN